MQSFEELKKTIIVSPTEDLQRRRRPHLPSDDNPNYVYGLATEYSVPVGKLISYHYQREWENMVIAGIYEKKKKEYEEKMKKEQEAKAAAEETATTSADVAAEVAPEPQKIEEESKAETECPHKIIHQCHCHDSDQAKE